MQDFKNLKNKKYHTEKILQVLDHAWGKDGYI